MNTTIIDIISASNTSPQVIVVDITPMTIFNLVIVWTLYMIFMIAILFYIRKWFDKMREQRKKERESYEEVYE